MGDVRFGDYRLERMLGEGGMGQVWLARDRAGARVALKLLPVRLASDASFRLRFEREAQLAAGLRDPHLVAIHRHGSVDGQLFIEMDYVEGTDLGALLTARGPLQACAAVEILDQVAAALDTAHAAGLVHRDVKPSNILVRADGFAYLIDFGIARGVGQTGLTATGLAIGTWAYMAPERFNGVSDARTDIYSLACVLYECVTGRRPYGDTDPARQMHDHLMTAPPRPSTVRPAVPAALDEVIARGMAKSPGDRHPSAGEFARAARVAVGLPVETVAPQASSIAPAKTDPPPTRVETRLDERSGAVAGAADAGRDPGALDPPRERSSAGSEGVARTPTPTKVMSEPGPPPTRVQTRLAPPVPVRAPVPVHAPVPVAPTPAAYRPHVPVPVRGPYVRPPTPAYRTNYPVRAPMQARRWSGRRPVPVRPRGKWVAPRRRRGGVLSKVIGALVVVFLAPFAFAAGCFALIAAGTSSSSQETTMPRPPVVAESSEPNPGSPPTAAPSGSAVRDGKFEFAVTDVRTGVSRVGLQTPRGSFVIVALDVRNISDETKWFLPFGQKLVDEAGRTLDHDTAATAWQTVSHGQGYSFELPPGGAATTQLVFDLPADSTPSHLELHDFVLSGGVTVQL
ncbi:serine/threonine-protein kinase [Nocardia bovistercoris]|uniref:non-specific serine/threonine protein kinase n=1 Tax=Nocardia bovistercoris TaxID=2785916 RepID=A0A931IC30_9NOCA|nr:serine/threonine-protein kinase [Nocardia bovistercoris]MBH0777422.1 protein kinase [Nocardia bovistercoris]